MTPNYLVALSSYQAPGGLPGVIFCKVIGSQYFVFLLGKVSCLTVTCLAVERWYSVVKPVKYRLKFKRRRVYVYLLIMWITCLLLHSFVLFEITLDEKNLRCVWITSDFPKELTVMTYTVVTFFVPNTVTWVTYLHISFALKRSTAINKNNARFTRTRFKLLRMCIIVALLLTICWFPNQLYYALSSYDLVRLESPFHHFTIVLAMFNSCTNPVVYCSTNREYRNGFLMLLCPFFNSCRWKKRREISLAQKRRLRIESGEFEMGKFDGGVILTFRNLVNQGYEVDDCKQQETSGVWAYSKNRLAGFSLHFSLSSCGQACYTFAKLPDDEDEADCGLTISVSSTGGKCTYSGKVVPSFIPGDRSPWAPAGEKCLIGRYVTTWHFLNSTRRQNLHRLLV